MSTPPNATSSSRLLPADWHRAPVTYWRIDPKDAFIFLCLNLLLGTCGLWIPVLIAPLFGKSLGHTFDNLLTAGAAYLFVIPFLAAICYSVIDTELRAQEGGARKQYLVYIVTIAIFCIVAALLIPSHVYGNGPAATKFWIQILVCLLASVVGVYVFCLLRIDTSQSIPDDRARQARALSSDATNAESDRSDFES